MLGAMFVANMAAASLAEDFELLREPEVALEVAETLDSEPNLEEKQQEFLQRLKDDFNLSKAGYQQLLNKVADTREHLGHVAEEKTTLQQQMRNMDAMLDATTKALTDVVKQMVEVENEIRVIYDEIEVREVALEYQKETLRDYLRVLYQEQDVYLSIDGGEVNAFKMLLADGSVGENLQRFEYLDMLNEAGMQLLEQLESVSADLENYQYALSAKKNELTALKEELEVQKEHQTAQLEAKQNLLNLTLGQEKIYGKLLEETVEEQEELLADVKSLSDAIAFVEEKIAEDGANFNPDDYPDLIDERTSGLYNFKYQYDGNFRGFDWPVDPWKGISAYFRDQDYVGVFGVQHDAADIPQYQGSAVRAAADGYVFKVSDNGYGYSYIVLAHADGFSTVYGHMSEMLVKEKDVVFRGSIIGLSGGMPGTKGAGYMTTGPHLHFELHLNGTPVDPLKYLPLSKLPEVYQESLPAKYLPLLNADLSESEAILR